MKRKGRRKSNLRRLRCRTRMLRRETGKQWWCVSIKQLLKSHETSYKDDVGSKDVKWSLELKEEKTKRQEVKWAGKNEQFAEERHQAQLFGIIQGDIRTQTGETRADAADEENLLLKLKSKRSMVVRSRRSHSTLNLGSLASAAVRDKKKIHGCER